MPVPRSDDNVTLGELARRLDRFAEEIQGSINRTVNREVYERDMATTNRRLEELEEAVVALAVNRRQALYAILSVCGAMAAAAIGALISSGGHL